MEQLHFIVILLIIYILLIKEAVLFRLCLKLQIDCFFSFKEAPSGAYNGVDVMLYLEAGGISIW